MVTQRKAEEGTLLHCGKISTKARECTTLLHTQWKCSERQRKIKLLRNQRRRNGIGTVETQRNAENAYE